MKKRIFLFFISGFTCCVLHAQTGIISTIAGNGFPGYSTGGSGDIATMAELNSDGGVAVDKYGNVYIADGANNVIRKVNTSGVISTVAGNGYRAGMNSGGYSGDGGPATAAELFSPGCVRVDTLGNIYLTDTRNALIRKINTSGIINTIAGNYSFGDGYSGDDGPATVAELNYPVGMCVDKHLNVYYADENSNVIREIMFSNGIISTVAGTGNRGNTGDGGYATAAKLYNPTGVAIDNSGNLYIADYGNNEVRIVNTSGMINNFTGNGNPFLNYSFGGANSPYISLNPAGICTDAQGNVYIADQINSVIWEVIDSTNQIYVIAGNNYNGYSGDGGPALNAEVQSPFDVAVDAHNNVYIADQGNNVVREVTATCAVDTVATYIFNSIRCSGDSEGGIGAYTNSPYPLTYSWSGNVGAFQQTSQYVNGLPTGTYTVSVTDVFGCTSSASVTLTQPSTSALGITMLSVNNVSCYGGNGSATANSASGGMPPYTYYWTGGGGTSLTTTPLSAGTYTIYVSDNNSCYASATVTITQPAFPLYITMGSVNNVSCFGGHGSATADTATGGTSPYTYLWSSGAGTNLTTTPISGGTYTISVTDNNGCTAMATATITQPASPLGITIATQTNINCNSIGGATANAATGGTSPYMYSWSGGGGTNLTASNLSAGTYSITAFDNNGCSAVASVTITQISQVLISISSQTNVSCNGENNGSATAVAATGGTPPYIYSWTSGGGNNLTVSNIGAGTYTITATDNIGCMGTAAVTITQPDILTVSENLINVNCNGANTGSVLAAPSGGTSPYTYSWSNGATTSSISSLFAGAYVVKITDYQGCTTTSSVTITQPPLLTATAAVLSNNSCNGDSSGKADVSAGGGTGTYIYSWAPSGGSSNIATGLPAGTYTITVEDGNNCRASAIVTITQPSLALQYSIIDTAQNRGRCTGAATISASGGTSPYTYSWSPSGQTTATATGLCAGTMYCCTVTDNYGCTGTSTDFCYQVTTVGIENITNSSDIKIYPDPNNGHFTVDGIWRGQIMELYNYLGQKVMSMVANETTMHINISSQSNGVYLIRILDKEGYLVNEKKVVKVE